MIIIQNKIDPAILNSLIKTLEEYKINYFFSFEEMLQEKELKIRVRKLYRE